MTDEPKVEAGAGAVLSGLLRTIVTGAKCTPFGEAADIEKLGSRAI